MDQTCSNYLVRSQQALLSCSVFNFGKDSSNLLAEQPTDLDESRSSTVKKRRRHDDIVAEEAKKIVASATEKTRIERPEKTPEKTRIEQTGKDLVEREKDQTPSPEKDQTPSPEKDSKRVIRFEKIFHGPKRQYHVVVK